MAMKYINFNPLKLRAHTLVFILPLQAIAALEA